MSRVRVHIDQIAVRGLDAADSTAAIEGLRVELARVLRDATALPARSHRTPVMTLAPLTLQPGAAGARQLGVKAAGAIARKVRP
jgi:hypothetical protein